MGGTAGTAGATDAALAAASFAARAASFSRSMSCFDLTNTPAGMCTFGAAVGVSPAIVADAVVSGNDGSGLAGAAAAACFAANSSRNAEALMLSTVLETDFTSGPMILRSFRSAISTLFSMPSSSASLWMRMLMQR